VRCEQSVVTANNGHHGDGLRRRKCHVVEGPRLALFRAIAGDAIRAVALPEEFSRLRVETLPYRLKILGGNLSFETKQFSTASVPGLRPSDSGRSSRSVGDGAVRSLHRRSWHESSARHDASSVRDLGSSHLVARVLSQ